MSSELNIDDTKELFTIDKEFLSFKLDVDNLFDDEPLKMSIVSETQIKVSNITDNFLAFRTKTTKALYYTVNPTYCIIAPKEIKIISISFLVKGGEKLQLRGHKFKLQAFIIQENEKDKEPKNLYNEYIQKGIPVIGCSEKTLVQFSDNNENIKKISTKNVLSFNNNNKKIGHARIGSDFEYVVTEEKKENNNNPNPLLANKIQSNEDKKTTLSDMIIETKKTEIKEEQIKNDKNNEISEKKEVENIEKSEKNDEKILNLNISNEKKEQSMAENKCANENKESLEINNNKISDMSIIIALFMAMIIGFLLV